MRICTAPDLIEQGRAVPKQVATACGFASVETLRRRFVRYLGITPSKYRRRHGRRD